MPPGWVRPASYNWDKDYAGYHTMAVGYYNGLAPVDHHQLEQRYSAFWPRLGQEASYAYTVGSHDLQVLAQHLMPDEDLWVVSTPLVDFVARRGIAEPLVVWRRHHITGGIRACTKGEREYKLRDLTILQRWQFSRLFPGWSFHIKPGKRAVAYLLWHTGQGDGTIQPTIKPYALRVTAEGESIKATRHGPFPADLVYDIWPRRAGGYHQTATFPLLQCRLVSLLHNNNNTLVPIAMVPETHPMVRQEDRIYARHGILYLCRTTDLYGAPLWQPAAIPEAWSPPTFQHPWQGLPPVKPREEKPVLSDDWNVTWERIEEDRHTRIIDTLGSYFFCQRRIAELVPHSMLALPYGVAVLLPHLPLEMLKVGLMEGIIRVRFWCFLHSEADLVDILRKSLQHTSGNITCAGWPVHGVLGLQERLWRARTLGALLTASSEPDTYYQQCFRHRRTTSASLSPLREEVMEQSWDKSQSNGLPRICRDGSPAVAALFNAAKGYLAASEATAAFAITEDRVRRETSVLQDIWMRYCAGHLSKFQAEQALGVRFRWSTKPQPLYNDPMLEAAAETVRKKAGRKGIKKVLILARPEEKQETKETK